MRTVLILRKLNLLVSLLVPLAAHADRGGENGQENRLTRYQQINLVSDQPGQALRQDSDLVNAWGISFRPAGSPFWISDNGTGLTTLYSVTYDAQGMVQVAKQGLVVSIPGEGTPSGQVFNGTAGFNGDPFIFVSEDGTVSGWRFALGTVAQTLTMAPGAVYKGVTIYNGMLLAANFSAGTVDVYDSGMGLQPWADPTVPTGYAPFNVQVVAGAVFVTFARQDAAKKDDVPGRGHGLIDLFDPQTGKFTRFATGTDAGGNLPQINSPWGMALAPSTFGKHADQLLVGNFGSGTIMAFEASGQFRGLLKSTHGGPVTIDGLWALTFGGNAPAGRPSTLYFTAGPDGENHGLFGSLDPVAKTQDDSDED
jgi:uncharacterized protein (TIGR03118 family)